MMIPLVMRTTEEVLVLVPQSYREAGAGAGHRALEDHHGHRGQDGAEGHRHRES